MASDPVRLPEILFSRTDAEAAMADAKTIAAELIDLAREQGMHPVAVFDIDETLLLNHEDDDDLVARNPPVAALHAWLRDEDRAEYTYATDDEALAAFQRLAKLEGIIPALESSHAIAEVIKAAPGMRPDQIIIANLSGRGDKDVAQVADLITL